MIDKEKRKKLAWHLRHISIGLITNDDFENSVLDDVSHGWLPEQYYRAKEAKLDDPIIVPMLELCWGLYDDTRRHKLIGSDKLPNESLKIIARCILFLQSDKEYEWPYFDTKFNFSVLEFITALLTLGHNFRIKKRDQKESYEEFKKVGEYDFWPFFRKIDYENQLTNPPFLNGQLITHLSD
jgi:hypothetical protein